jgi:predicted permease
VDVPAAEAELTTIARKLAEEHPRSNADKTVATLAPIAEDLLGQPGRALALLGIALGAVLLMACGNLANLLLASASLREVEFSVRGALGAGRYRLARQIAAETAMLSTVSAAIALAAAPWLARMFHAAYPTPLPRGEMPALAPSSLLATAAMAFSAAVLLAAPQMASAYRSSRSAGPAGTRTTARGDRFTGYALISVQVALSLLLLAAGVALVRTLAKLEAVDPGYRTDGLLTFSVSPSPQRFRTAASATLFYDEVVRSIGELPGVRAAAAGVGVPLTSGGWRFGIRRPGAATDTLVAVNLVSPGYFDALGVRPREGRLLTDAEQRTGAGVAMVNASLARVLSAGGESVVGRQMNYSGQAWTIVGVLEDVRQSGPRNAVMPELVIPWHLAGKRPQAIVVRSDGDPLRLLPAITARIHAIDPTAPLTDVARIQDRLRKDTAAERFRASLLAALAGVAILLAALGAYSVTAYAVARRTREYGIRLALGERPRAVCRRALRTAVSPAIAGLVLGTGASLAGARFLQGFLHEVDAADAGTLAIGGAILLAIATAAAAMSARRAAHVDPIVALRAE